MQVKNNLYRNFKPFTYNPYSKAKANKKNAKPIIGAVLGVAGGMVLSRLLLKKETPDEKTIIKALRLLFMAGGGNVGAVLGGSIGATSDSKKRKWKEAGFQVMNSAIPMLFVTKTIDFIKSSKTLNAKKAPKIIGSIIAMTSGAWVATQITNIGKPKEERRKYTIKDSVANIDDMAATIVFGFPQYKKLSDTAEAMLPLIYAYCGQRAGYKE